MERRTDVSCFEVEPSQFQLPGGRYACTTICLTTLISLQEIKNAADIFRFNWKHSLSCAVEIYQMWHTWNMKRTGQEQNFSTIYEIMTFSTPLRNGINRMFEIEEVGGFIPLFDPRCQKEVAFSLEEIVEKVGVGGGICITIENYTFLVFRTRDRWILFDSHGVRASQPCQFTTIRTCFMPEILCAEMRQLFASTHTDAVGAGDATDIFSAILLHPKSV